MNTIGFYNGDARSVFMAGYLADKFLINTYNLATDKNIKCNCMKTAEELFEKSDIIVTPVSLFINNEKETNDFCKFVQSKNIVFGGCFPQKLTTYFIENNIKYYDYMENEEFVLYNTISTAEGVIAIAISQININLCESNILIIGYGRCAKTLIRKINGLCKSVCVAARKECDLFNAKIFGCDSFSISELKCNVNKYDIIINSVPALVLDEEVLKEVNKNSLIIDIASKPGGVDFDYCSKYDLNAIHALGLPGKYSPISTAKFLCGLLLKNIT